jgi:hypothetical protein
MILFRFAPKPNPRIENWAALAHRWTIRVDWFSIGIDLEYFSARGDGWRTCYTDYAHVGIAGRWHWGRTHDYYDGPHDALWLGPLYVSWSLGWCEGCMP